MVGSSFRSIRTGNPRTSPLPLVTLFNIRKTASLKCQIQVYTYINVLYSYVLNINDDTEFTLYNGAAESLNTLSSGMCRDDNSQPIYIFKLTAWKNKIAQTTFKINYYTRANASGAIAAYSIGKIDSNWYKRGCLFLAIGSILAGLVLLGCFYVRVLWFIYAFYIIYGCLYQTMY